MKYFEEICWGDVPVILMVSKLFTGFSFVLNKVTYNVVYVITANQTEDNKKFIAVSRDGTFLFDVQSDCCGKKLVKVLLSKDTPVTDNLKTEDTETSDENECKKEMLILAGELLKIQEWVTRWLMNSTKDPGNLEIIEKRMDKFNHAICALCHLSRNNKSDFIKTAEGKIKW